MQYTRKVVKVHLVLAMAVEMMAFTELIGHFSVLFTTSAKFYKCLMINEFNMRF